MTRWLHYLLFLPEQGSTFAPHVDRLHYFIILTTVVVAAVIGAVGLYWLIRYRAQAPDALTEKIQATKGQELVFVLFPLTFFLLWFFLGFRDYVWTRTVPKGSMDVYVTAKQWMWKFTYPQGPSSINTLRVPLGRPVRLLITSRDVIHSFFVPGFRIKQDAIPGRYTEIWFEASRPGPFDILCAEYCGLNHSMMRGQVLVVPANEFEDWMNEQRRGHPDRADALQASETDSPQMELQAMGKLVAEREGCVKCHSVDGTAHIGPTWLDLYGRTERLATGQTVQVDEAYITQSMMQPASQVVAGFNPVMPTFEGHLTPGETAAIIEFMKSLKSTRLVPTPSERPVYVPVP